MKPHPSVGWLPTFPDGALRTGFVMLHAFTSTRRTSPAGDAPTLSRVRPGRPAECASCADHLAKHTTWGSLETESRKAHSLGSLSLDCLGGPAEAHTGAKRRLCGLQHGADSKPGRSPWFLIRSRRTSSFGALFRSSKRPSVIHQRSRAPTASKPALHRKWPRCFDLCSSTSRSRCSSRSFWTRGIVCSPLPRYLAGR